MKRDNIETFRLPFLLDEVLDELRLLIWCTASQLALMGRSELAEAMIEPDADFGMSESPSGYLPKIDLAAFDISEAVKEAYDFAFQINDPGRFSADDWGDLMALVSGGVRNSWSGEVSPLCHDNSKLRHVADMVQGRVSLLTGDALSIRQLALLANMIEPAVRSSLSAEGIKTEGRPASLPAATAQEWLRRRRGFVPTTDGRAVQHLGSDAAVLEVRPFPAALEHLIASCHKPSEELAALAGLDASFLARLADGSEHNAGVQDLVLLARALRLEPQPLVDAYVRFVAR